MGMNRFVKAAAIAIGVVTASASAQAALIGVSKYGKIISAPSSVADDSGVRSNKKMLGFDEQQDVLLTADLKVDGGTIAAGMRISSHMILLNTKGNKRLRRVAQWMFDGVVLGVMSDKNGLLEAASNSLLGASGTHYPGGFANRGFENRGKDYYTGVGSNKLNVSMKVSEPGDWIRVITASPINVPAPGALGLLAVGLAGMCIARRRKA